MTLVGATIAYSASADFELQSRLKSEGQTIKGRVEWITPENISSMESNQRYIVGCTRIIIVRYEDATSQTKHLSFKNCNDNYVLDQPVDITRLNSPPESAILTKDVTSPNYLAYYSGVGGGMAFSAFALLTLIYLRAKPKVEQPDRAAGT